LRILCTDYDVSCNWYLYAWKYGSRHLPFRVGRIARMPKASMMGQARRLLLLDGAPNIALVNISSRSQECARCQNPAFTEANIVVAVHASK
jgi:hypothetical protein